MSHEKDIKRLIEKHTRRLQKLKEQQAVFGLHTPPYVLTEIEDAEVEIEQLRTELNEVVSTGKETVQTQRNFLWLWISSALLVIVISLLGMSSILTTLSNETPKIITTSQKVVPPTQASSKFAGTWNGTTEQGESISFMVAPNASGEAAFNLSFSFIFDAPCPIGRVSFKSLDNAHIFGGPSYHFSFLNLKTSNAVGNLEGNLTDTTASGTLSVNDARNPDTRQRLACPFITTIKWNATKQ